MLLESFTFGQIKNPKWKILMAVIQVYSSMKSVGPFHIIIIIIKTLLMATKA